MLVQTVLRQTLFQRTLLALAIGTALALPAQADTWRIDIDTTSLAGISGSLDLQLNPVPATPRPCKCRSANSAPMPPWAAGWPMAR